MQLRASSSVSVKLRRAAAGWLTLAVAAVWPPSLCAQELPRGPLTLAGGHVILAADVSASTSTNPDKQGWFNYTDYQYNALRLLRIGFSAAVHATDRIALLTELRSENAEHVSAAALYVRVRPWKSRPISIQAGRIPPVFGAFGRRAYAADNPLIGYPLAYHYLTSLRPDAVPRTANDLLGMRARGWLSSFPIGAARSSSGSPLISAFRWDTGVEVHVGDGPIEANAAVTTGTLSNPRISDDNDGKQISARVVARPVVGLVAGASVSRGAFLSKSLDPRLPAGTSSSDFTQQAWGVDAEYSRDYWLVRAEGIVSRWRLPAFAEPRITDPLEARAFNIEGRYKLLPGLFAAGRFDRLTFSRITGTAGTFPWDAALRRIEIGGGYYLQRNAVIKVAYQRNTRDGGRLRLLNIGAAQLQVWF